VSFVMIVVKFTNIHGKIKHSDLAERIAKERVKLEKNKNFELKVVAKPKRKEYEGDSSSSDSEGSDCLEESRMFNNKNTVDRALVKLDIILSKKCKKCNCVKPPHAHHCSVCKRCIARMDHHCPWVNNCVGYYTQKHFMLFLIYSLIGCVYSALLLVLQTMNCFQQHRCMLFMELTSLLIGIGTFFLISLFGLFVVVMLFDQVSCIIDNSSTIDRLQGGSKANKKSLYQAFKEVFGGPFSIKWLLPIDIKTPLIIEQEYA